MIDFRALGRLELRTVDGQEITSVLAQPKRLALLSGAKASYGRYLLLRSDAEPALHPQGDSVRVELSALERH